MSKGINALMPAHGELARMISEQIADDYAGEQFAPNKQPDPIFELQGQPQLVAIAQIYATLAIKIKWLLNSIEEADFDEALNAMDHVAFSLRSLRLEFRPADKKEVK